MAEFMFGITYEKPSRKEAARRDRICREEGGHGYVEVNVTPNDAPGINGGRYQGWFVGPNHGSPFDVELAARVLRRVTESDRKEA